MIFFNSNLNQHSQNLLISQNERKKTCIVENSKTSNKNLGNFQFPFLIWKKTDKIMEN